MRSHLKKIADNHVPVRAMCNGTFYARCTFAYSPEREPEPRLIIENGRLFNDDIISISYSVDASTYAFETRVLEVYEAGPGRTSLRVALPERIARFERRKASRVVPSEESPVLVRLSAGNAPVEIEAENISLHGIALSVPSSCRPVLGSRLAMEIVLPMFGSIEAEGLVRSISEHHGFAKLGLELKTGIEYHRALLGQYVHLRQIELRRGGRPFDRPKRESAFVITKETDEGTCLFLCTDSSVQQIEDFNHFSQVVSMDVLDYLTADTAPAE